jgi:hypothetical protein
MNVFEASHDRLHRQGVRFEAITGAFGPPPRVPSPRAIEAV